MSVQVGYPLRETRRQLARQKMALRRKRGMVQNVQQNGLYVHSSPPRVVQMNPSVIRQWLRNGEIDKLETVVLEGQGHKLVGEYSPDAKTRSFLKTVPQYMAKIELLHDAVSRGQIQDTQKLLKEDSRKKLSTCKGQQGVGLLHKAVYFDHQDLAKWMIDNYPLCVTTKDREGRTALHYCAATTDPSALWELLVAAGVEENALDSKGHLANYYLDHPRELSLPALQKPSGVMKRYTDGKDGLVPTRANIRIWIHDRDLGRLQQMLWEGHGGKLRVETSNNPRVKRFLDAVPYIMGTIKDTHTAAINDDIEIFKKRTADPVPAQIMLSKDENGLNPLHKAAGLGHEEIVTTIIERCPKAVNAGDSEGRTPLHYAAVLKDNGRMYNLLVGQGADEGVEDHKGKSPSFYKQKPAELDPKSLKVVPEAPRTAASFPPAWDWRILSNLTYDFGHINGFIAPVSEIFANKDSKEQIIDKMNGADLMYLDVPAPILDEKRPDAHDVEEDEGVGEEEADQTRDMENIRDEYERGAEEGGFADTAELVDQNYRDAAVEQLQGEGYIDERKFNEDVMEENEKQHDEDEHWNIDKREDGEIMQHDDNEEVHNEREEDYEDEGLERERELTPETGADQVTRVDEAEEMAKPPPEEEEDTREYEDHVVGDKEAETELENSSLDPEVAELVRVGNMEELATMVLNGDGKRLVGHSSEDPELQSFLNNVPSYMSKIRAVHVAAREGQLRDLQGSLDRRKFAVARDGVSPMGATPLHVATLFGNTTIVRYLGARFPETLNAKDLDNRTPLHYAATIRDNGHYYNMLLNLGANPTLKDNRGRTAEYYLRNPERLTHKMLLAEFGASEQIADDTLADKDGLITTSSHSQVDMPVYWTEEGRYLADALGEPLIKGLTEVANKRPKDPVNYLANYLYNYANHDRNVGGAIPQNPQAEIIRSRPGSSKILPILPSGIPEQSAMLITQGVVNAARDHPDHEPEPEPEREPQREPEHEPEMELEPEAEVFEHPPPYPHHLPPPSPPIHAEPLLLPDGPVDDQELREDQELRGEEGVMLDEEEEEEKRPTPSPETAFSSTSRDEHGQSMLHFAAARAHGRNALFELLQETEINIGYRDELYRTGRDVAVVANLTDNVKDIDKWILHLAANGETEKLGELLLEGYNHVIPEEDEGNPTNIVEIALERNHQETATFLQSLPSFEESREQIHSAVREGDLQTVQEMLSEDPGAGRLLAVGKNAFGRCSLHLAVLHQNEQLTDYIANAFPETLKIGDNLERTPLHYAMGLEKVEDLSTILIQAGAKRVFKDLKGRQPSYYFMNKTDILRLQSEEEESML